MTSSLAFNLALVAGDQVLYLVLGIIALASLVALGGKFFVNLFEVVTAPAASLGHHGQQDNFFFSMVVVFLGGLIATFILFTNQEAMSLNFHDYSVAVAGDAALANSNETYRQIAADWGSNLMESRFSLYFTDNLVFLPVVLVILWIILGAIVFIGAKMMGAQCSMVDFLGSLAYGAFFVAIGFGMCAAFMVEALSSFVTGDPIMPGVLAIAGIVLLLFGLVLYFVGIAQAAGISAGQVLVTIILLLIVLGGLGYWAYSEITPAFQDFLSQISSYNPAR